MGSGMSLNTHSKAPFGAHTGALLARLATASKVPPMPTISVSFKASLLVAIKCLV